MSLTLSNVGEPSKVKFRKNHIQVQKERGNLFLSSFVYSEMYKKATCMCKIVVLVIKPLAFFTFSLPSPSLDLKVP